MASRPSPNSLIHCAVCGEDYSATYKRCPFCGAKNMPTVTPGPAYDPDPRAGRRPADPDDTYVFDGQDLFDDEYEDDYAPVRPRGGKRLAEKSSSSPFASAEINWPRVITFLCSLVIIIAAMIIVFTGIYPKLRGNKDKDPTAEGSGAPTAAVTDPAGEASQPVAPIPTSDVGQPVDPDDPVTDPTPDVPPDDVDPDPDTLTTISFKGPNDADFTLKPEESHTITLNFDPSGWSGDVTWTSSDPEYATVDANGKVTNVNSTSQLHRVVVTVSAEGLTLESIVRCKGVSSTEPPATDEPTQTDPPSNPGTVTVGKRGTVVGADGGLRVRSGPGTDNSVLATITNGTSINVVSDAGNGWYEITFSGSGGTTVTGYIMGEYISTD